MVNCFFPARRTYFPRPTPQPRQPASKLVPVHFVDDKHRSAKFDRSAAAITIQKIVRGFLVRKNIRTIKKIAAEEEEIRPQISALKIRNDAKERLRIGEVLMSLLLQLDAVRGVREYRKKVIRHVIQLQEAVDSIAQGGIENLDSNKCTEVSKAIDNTVISVGDDDSTIREEFEDDGEEKGKSIENSMQVMAELTPAARAEDGFKMKETGVAAETRALRGMLGELQDRSVQQCELMSKLVQQVERLEGRMQMMEQARNNQADSALGR